MTEVHARLAFGASEPALAGHFPGNPIVPGALLLEEVAAIVRRHWQRPVAGVAVAKFRRPLLPDREYELSLSARNDGRIEFACTHESETMVSGVLVLAEPS